MANGDILANITDVDTIKEAVIEGLSSSMGPLITIFKVVGIALLVYIIFLILRAVFRWRTMSKIVKISKDVSQINEKLDVLITKFDKFEKPKENKETIEKKDKKRKKGKNKYPY